ncbi:unnamed protein product [Toxocara canis]|uniref:EIF-4F 25 kDa subunit n=1 Tax=Toxocara canis TaxID=6265 RepID=A0A183UFR3_TOXCA|nr:unnamed protein product [Toxocara canis]
MNAENSEQGDLVPLPANTPRHFLQCRWLLWYLKADRGRDWEDCLRQIAVFGTFEEFWALYKHIQPPSELTWGSDYCLFKEGIKSMWEDGSNISWLFWTIPQDFISDRLELSMAFIGEHFEDNVYLICGAVVNVRQNGDKVSFWTRDSFMDDANLRVGQILKAKLGISDAKPIRYEVHKDLSVRTGSMVEPVIVIPTKENWDMRI